MTRNRYMRNLELANLFLIVGSNYQELFTVLLPGLSSKYAPSNVHEILCSVGR